MDEDKYKRTWFCYGLGMTDEQAAEEFTKRFGYQPEQVVRDHNLIWCGPVYSGKESDDDTERAEPVGVDPAGADQPA